jgi:tRNA (guanine-N7-)-methyltransferase
MTAIWPHLSLNLPIDGMIDLAALFTAPTDDLWLEIGFGGGEHLSAQALRHPNIGFIGCEPFVNGVASLVVHIQAHDLSNIRVVKDDAKVLIRKLPDQSVGCIFVLFPDPWPKKRHHKRRIIQDAVIDEFTRILKQGGRVCMATDHEEYGVWMQSVMARHPQFCLDMEGRASVKDRPQDWPQTRYEQKGIRQGRGSVYLLYKLTQ